jgi:hypothetical protein
MSRRLIDIENATVSWSKEDVELYEDDFAGGVLYALDKLTEEAPTIDVVELPLKIGEKCYCILNHKNEVIEDIVDDYDIWSIKDGVKLRIRLLNYNDYVIGEYGKTAFKTREEAETEIERRNKNGMS